MLIGNDWKIESDTYNVILYKRKVVGKVPKHFKPFQKRELGESDSGDAKSNERWDVVGYYATVANALKELVNRSVRETSLIDLRVISARLDALYEMIDKLRLEKEDTV